MLDINNNQISVGQFLKVTGCTTKGDNSIYIVDKQYEKGDYCLYKVLQNGEVSKAKYNIYFLDDKHDTEKQVTIITKEQLKQAAKEVKVYINGLTAKEMVYTFTRTEEQQVKQGLYIHFKKSVLFKGHINNVGGTFEITKVLDDAGISLHLIGAKGEQIADNMNGYYQFTPIHINLASKTIQQLFDENNIEILERTASTKGDIVEHSISVPTIETALEEVTEPIETTITNNEQQDEKTKQPTQTVKAHYFPINERAADTANTLNSHYDYVKGSATQAYKNTVNAVAEKAQIQITKKEKLSKHIMQKLEKKRQNNILLICYQIYHRLLETQNSA